MDAKEITKRIQRIIDEEMPEHKTVNLDVSSTEDAIRKALIESEKFTADLVQKVLIDFFANDHSED